MKCSKEITAEAKKCVSLSLDVAGEVSHERVAAVLQALKAHRPVHVLRPLLKAYKHYLSIELSRGHGRVEHAGAITPGTLQSLAAHLSVFAKRPVSLSAHETPALIAGLRVTLGDHVWESSVSSRLERLKTAF